MTCSCAYYEPGLISYVSPTCPEHGEEAQRKSEVARDRTRAKLREAGITEWDLRDIGFVPNSTLVRL